MLQITLFFKTRSEEFNIIFEIPPNSLPTPILRTINIWISAPRRKRIQKPKFDINSPIPPPIRPPRALGQLIPRGSASCGECVSRPRTRPTCQDSIPLVFPWNKVRIDFHALARQAEVDEMCCAIGRFATRARAAQAVGYVLVEYAAREEFWFRAAVGIALGGAVDYFFPALAQKVCVVVGCVGDEDFEELVSACVAAVVFERCYADSKACAEVLCIAWCHCGGRPCCDILERQCCSWACGYSSTDSLPV